jgi:orotidine-5'-phosphate decarboxylase
MSSNSDLQEARKRLILALDVPTLEEASAMLDRLEGQVGMVKVGLELFAACGPHAVEAVKARGYEVFLDLKLHDIPNTVAGAVRSARAHGVAMLTLHTGGGRAMLEAAREAAAGEIRLLGVTLLTSMGAEDLEAVAIEGPPEAVVLRRAGLARAASLGGIVCSPKETAKARAVVGDGMAIVTPGIRPAGTASGDQKRAATPASAIGDGADYLVIGRPIGAASDPAGAAAGIVREISEALGRR